MKPSSSLVFLLAFAALPTACGLEEEGCLPGRTECSGECFNLQIDGDHCGDCDNACGSGQFCVAGSCVDEPNLPDQADIDWASGLVESGTSVADIARTALEMLGLLPTYECEEPRATFTDRIGTEFGIEHPCATVTVEPGGTEADVVTLAFPPGGCEISGLTLTGQAVFSYAGGTDSMSLEADFTALQVNGEPVGALAGYGTCGDEKRFWAQSQGDVPGRPGWSYALDVTVGMRGGLPVIGGTTLLLNGTASLTSPGGTDQLAFEELEYELGSLLPKAGTLIIQTASGRTIRATFSESFLAGEVRIQIDDYDAVTVPVF